MIITIRRPSRLALYLLSRVRRRCLRSPFNVPRSPDGGDATSTTTTTAASISATSTTTPTQHKWPLRPGVHVHVNGAHSLSTSRLPPPPKNLNKINNDGTSSSRRQRRATSLGHIPGAEEINQHARANRIRQMFSTTSSPMQRERLRGAEDGMPYRCETLPGVIRARSGGIAVIFL